MENCDTRVVARIELSERSGEKFCHTKLRFRENRIGKFLELYLTPKILRTIHTNNRQKSIP